MNDKETIENPLRAGQFFYSCTVWRVCAISSVYGTRKGGRTHTQPTRRPVCENRPRRYRYLNPFPPLFLAFGCAGRKDWIVLPPRRGNTTPTYRTLSNQINSSMTCSISAKYIVVVSRRNRSDAPNSWMCMYRRCTSLRRVIGIGGDSVSIDFNFRWCPQQIKSVRCGKL